VPVPSWSWESGVARLVAGTAVGLVVGLVLGVLVARTDLLGHPAQAPPKARVSTGPVRLASDSDAGGSGAFELPVYNPTASPVDVRLVNFEGVASPVTSRPVQAVAPGTWRSIRFSTIANCDVAPAVGGVATVRLGIGNASGSHVRSVPLSGQGVVLLTYYRTVCGSSDQVTTKQLAGVWSLETAYGTSAALGKRLLLRFGRDGTFIADAEGRLFARHGAGVQGAYRVRGDVLTYHVRRGSSCLPGDQATWRVSMLGVEALSMVWVGGQCPAGEPGDAWVLRRVLADGELPD
jgi:hypothetical protein